jgi:chaperonin GroEL (HSP60 family)
LQSPLRQVIENAGADGSIVVGKLLEANDPDRGFDAQTLEYVDMVKHLGKGFGDADAVASSGTAQGRAQNRRVELSVPASGC